MNITIIIIVAVIVITMYLYLNSQGKIHADKIALDGPEKEKYIPPMLRVITRTNSRKRSQGDT